jgi:hypothetical protein
MSVDVEAMLTRFLRSQNDVAAIVEDRVYTELPHTRTYPLVRLQRTGGASLISRPPNWLTSAEITLDFYGASHKGAQVLMSTCIDAITNRLPGTQAEGVVTIVRDQEITYSPDEESIEETGHGRPRFQARLNVVSHP